MSADFRVPVRLVNYSAPSGTAEGSVGRCDLLGAFVVGLFGAANVAQGINLLGSEAFFRPMTAVMLPSIMAFGLLAFLREPKRLVSLWPAVVLAVMVLPSFFLPSYTGYLTDVEATPFRVLILICLPMICAGLIMRDWCQVNYLLGGLMVGALAVAIAVVVNPKRDMYNSALQAGETDTITTGVSMALGCLILIYWASRRPRFADPLALLFTVGALLLGYATLLTQSRQASLMLALGAPLLLLFLVTGSKRLWVSIPLGVAIVWYVAWFGFENGRAEVGFNRGDLWWPVLARIAEFPLGIGWGNYYAYAPSNLLEGVRYPHNLLIQGFLEGGLVFGLVLVLVLALAARQVWLQRKTAIVATLGIVWLTLLISAQVSSDITGGRSLAVVTGSLLGLRVTRILLSREAPANTSLSLSTESR